MTRTVSPRRSKTASSNRVPDIPELGPVEQVPLAALKPYDRNARVHDDRQVAKIAASLETFGWMTPIIADGENRIIAGHGRWMAASKLKLTHAPVIRVEHLSDDAVRAYRIADNKLAELAGWDDEILAIEFQHLSSVELDFHIEVTGFDHAEIDLIIDPDGEDKDKPLDAADRDVPDVQAVAVSRLGDLWLLDQHRLLCGSALEEASFALLMEDRKADMVFADAPYNCPVSGHVSGLGKVQHREFAMASGEMSTDQFTQFLGTNLQQVAAHVKDGAVLALCMDWRNLMPLQLAMAQAGLTLINMCVWAKSNAGMGSLYRSQHELVLIAKKGSAPHTNNVELGKHGRWRSNVWRYAGVNSFGAKRMEQLQAHPTVKPIALVADAIRDVSNRGEIVLDSFMGSGTTLLAAERTARIAYGMDIDPLYVDVAIRRWEEMTGKAAILAATGETFAQVAEHRGACDAVAEDPTDQGA